MAKCARNPYSASYFYFTIGEPSLDWLRRLTYGPLLYLLASARGAQPTSPHAISNTQSSATLPASGEFGSMSKDCVAVSRLCISPNEHIDYPLPRQEKQDQAMAEGPGAKLGASLEHAIVLSNEPSIDLRSTKMRPRDIMPNAEQKMSGLDPINTNGNSDDFEDDPLTLLTPDLVEPDDLKRPDCKYTSVSLEDLVDRLLSPLMSKSDAKFVSTFLCLYRKFAAPSDLMTAIVSRFRIVSESQDAHMLRITSQLRYLGVLAQWVSGYPGDFAHPITRHIATQFLSGLGNTRIFAAARAEMSNNLNVVVEDDDTEWACSDNGKSGAEKVTIIRRSP